MVAFDEGLATRLREYFEDKPDYTERKMFGGLCFMLSEHMTCGIVGDTLMARVGPDNYKACLARRQRNGFYRQAFERQGVCEH